MTFQRPDDSTPFAQGVRRRVHEEYLAWLAQISADEPPADQPPLYLAKYRHWMTSTFSLPEPFATDYSVALRVYPMKVRGSSALDVHACVEHGATTVKWAHGPRDAWGRGSYNQERTERWNNKQKRNLC